MITQYLSNPTVRTQRLRPNYTRILTVRETGNRKIVYCVRLLVSILFRCRGVKASDVPDFLADTYAAHERPIIDESGQEILLNTDVLSPPENVLDLTETNDELMKKWLECRRDFYRRSFFMPNLPHIVQGVTEEYRELFIVCGTIVAASYPWQELEQVRDNADNDNIPTILADNDNENRLVNP